jgi:hypothetical protein
MRASCLSPGNDLRGRMASHHGCALLKSKWGKPWRKTMMVHCQIIRCPVHDSKSKPTEYEWRCLLLHQLHFNWRSVMQGSVYPCIIPENIMRTDTNFLKSECDSTIGIVNSTNGYVTNCQCRALQAVAQTSPVLVEAWIAWARNA